MVLPQQRVMRRRRGKQSGGVVLGEHTQEVVDAGPSDDAAAREGQRARAGREVLVEEAGGGGLGDLARSNGSALGPQPVTEDPRSTDDLVDEGGGGPSGKGELGESAKREPE